MNPLNSTCFVDQVVCKNTELFCGHTCYDPETYDCIYETTDQDQKSGLSHICPKGLSGFCGFVSPCYNTSTHKCFKFSSDSYQLCTINEIVCSGRCYPDSEFDCIQSEFPCPKGWKSCYGICYDPKEKQDCWEELENENWWLHVYFGIGIVLFLMVLICVIGEFDDDD